MSQIFWRWMSRLSAVLANSHGVTHVGSKYVLLGTVPRCEIPMPMHAHLQVSSDGYMQS